MLALALAAGLPVACYTTTVEPASDSERQQLVDDLQLSALARSTPISRAEVEDRLGTPFATYEGARIATYAVRKVRGRFEIAQPLGPASGGGADYRLVLVFGPDDTVERCSVVDRNRW